MLQEIATKARLYVPDGITLMGILDETNTLPPGTVFFQYHDPRTGILRHLLPGTRVAVSRSPCIHPGDCQVLTLATVLPTSSLHTLKDVVVFPQAGTRPHPDEMSGGDLDGDLYTLLFDPALVPTTAFPAMSYDPALPAARIPATSHTTHGTVTSTEMATFFIKYMQNDNLGRIANAHGVFADTHGAESTECLTLATLHATAVDFAKTGVPATFPTMLMPKAYPAFMTNRRKPTYDSTKVLGQLYRKVNALQVPTNQGTPVDCVDPDLILPGASRYMEDAACWLVDYNTRLMHLMLRYGVTDEQELMSGCVKEFSRKMSREKSRNGNTQERLNRELATLRRDFRQLFMAELDELDDYDGLKKASAWYQVTYETESSPGDPPRLISFPWVMSSHLLKIKELNGQLAL